MSNGRPTTTLAELEAVCGFDGRPRAPGRDVCADCVARIEKTAARLKAKRSDP